MYEKYKNCLFKSSSSSFKKYVEPSSLLYISIKPFIATNSSSSMNSSIVFINSSSHLLASILLFACLRHSSLFFGALSSSVFASLALSEAISSF